MREALIVWGGWSGHEPEKGAHIVAEMLEEHGFKVYIENTTEAFADPAIADMSLIVPIVTMSKIEKEEVENLTAAVRGGVGLAGYHGGMCDAFRDSVDYQFMCGGQWVAHPGNIIDYRVDIAKPDDPIMQGISSFPYRSEQYYMHVDPVERSAGDDDLLRRARAVDRGRRDAGGLEAQARRGPRLLLARSAMSPPSSACRRCGRSSSAACCGRRADFLLRTRTRRAHSMSAMQTDAAFAGLQTTETLTPSQIEARAKALRDQLSLDEKISLMHGQLSLWPGLAAMTAPGRLQQPVLGGRRGGASGQFPASASPTGRAASFWTEGRPFRSPWRGERPGIRRWKSASATLSDGKSALSGATTSAACASICCVTRPGAAPRKPTAKILAIWAPWAPR